MSAYQVTGNNDIINSADYRRALFSHPAVTSFFPEMLSSFKIAYANDGNRAGNITTARDGSHAGRFSGAVRLYSQRKITLAELAEFRMKKYPTLDIKVNIPLSNLASRDDGKIIIYDMATMRNPKTPEGDNRTRDEFTFSHYYHPKGKFFATGRAKPLSLQ